ncbi:MAG: hypothetical protein AB1Z23_02475 [Eubacteriales bacterium]
MKKSRLVVIGIVAALLLTGIAFAAWTASVDVNVNAKSGELNVEIVDKAVGAVSDYVVFAEGDVVISSDKKSATVSIDNMYPGAEAVFTVKVENVGTLPVDLSKLTHSAVQVLDKNTNESFGMDADLMQYFHAEYTAAVLDSAGATVDTLAPAVTNWVTDLFAANTLPSIEPGQSLELTVKVYMDDTADDNTENKLFKFTVTPLFSQAN